MKGLFYYIKDMITRFRMRQFLRDLDNSQDAAGFCVWAFGEGYYECSDFLELMARWNSRHWTKLTLDSNGLIMDDFGKMIDVWRKHDG